jgi:uncharacterized coiled-coil protein SlyX
MGQLLVERGQVTSTELEDALAEQQETGERLGEILVKHGHISRLDLASALSTQWSWRDEVPDSTASRATPAPPREESVEPEPVAAASEYAPFAPNEETLTAQIQSSSAPELTVERGLSQTTPATNPVPVYPNTYGDPASASTLGGETAPSPVGMEAFAALVGRVSGREDQDTLLRELQAQLRETREQLVGGEARLGALEAILAEFSQTYAALNARLDAQTREIEDLRRVAAEQETRITAAGRALLT